MPRQNQIQFRKGTYNQWDAQSSTVLGSGEPGFVTDFNKLKIGDGTTQWSDLSAINDALTTLVYNGTASTIPKMSVVYINGAQGDMPSIRLSIASGEMTSSKTYGITTNAISAGGTGMVVVDGALKNLNTSPAFDGVTPGTTLWLSPTVSGGITTTKPSGPNHMVSVGNLIRVHNQQGIINVKIQNGFELEELHNVAVTGATNGQFLQYNSGNGLWIPTSSGDFNSLTVNNNIVWHSGNFDSSNIVRTTGSQIITGNKDFGSNLKISASQVTSGNYFPTFGSNDPTSTSYALQYITKTDLVTSLFEEGKSFVNTTEVQQISGMKTFISPVIVNNNSTQIITRNGRLIPLGNITLDNSNTNFITFNDAATGLCPTNSTSFSSGLKILLKPMPTVFGAFPPVAIGLSNNSLWNVIPNSNWKYEWNAGSANLATLSGNGALSVSSIINSPTGIFNYVYSTSGFVKSGGTSDQFLKADGSVDSNTYLTSHPTISAASSSNNSGRTYIQDILMDSNGHVTGIATATETVTDTNTYVSSASFNTSDGLLTLTQNDASTVTVDLDGKYQNIINNPVIGVGTINHLAYWSNNNEITANSGQLYWDSSNYRLGIGTNAPSSTLHVSGLLTSSSGTIGNILISDNIVYSNGNLILSPSSSGSLQRDSGGDPRGTYAVDWQTSRSSGTNVASGASSVICGGNSNSAAGGRAVVCGGNNNAAMGTASSIGGGNTNTAWGIRSTIGGGQNNTTNTEGSTIGGGANNTINGINGTIGGGSQNNVGGAGSTIAGGAINSATGEGSTVAGGNSNSSAALRSTVGGGSNNSAVGRYSTVVGGDGAKTTKPYEVAHAGGVFVNAGDAQHTILMAKVLTSGNAPTNLFMETVGDRLTIPADKTTWTFDIKLSAYNNTDNLGAGWNIQGCIQRFNNVTTLIGTNVVNQWIPTGMSGVAASAFAATNNNALTIQVSGLANKNIRWVGVVDIAQVSWGVI